MTPRGRTGDKIMSELERIFSDKPKKDHKESEKPEESEELNAKNGFKTEKGKCAKNNVQERDEEFRRLMGYGSPETQDLQAMQGVQGPPDAEDRDLEDFVDVPVPQVPRLSHFPSFSHLPPFPQGIEDDYVALEPQDYQDAPEAQEPRAKKGRKAKVHNADAASPAPKAGPSTGPVLFAGGGFPLARKNRRGRKPKGYQLRVPEAVIPEGHPMHARSSTFAVPSPITNGHWPTSQISPESYVRTSSGYAADADAAAKEKKKREIRSKEADAIYGEFDIFEDLPPLPIPTHPEYPIVPGRGVNWITDQEFDDALKRMSVKDRQYSELR